jgi:REP element-mobilizing transposase RayT
LAQPEIAQGIIEALYYLRSAGKIRLHAFAVMPDHLHLIATLGENETVSTLMHSLKSYTAKEINKKQGRQGPVWQAGFHSHGIRDEREMKAKIHYVEGNPVKAGLAGSIEEYELGSGCARYPLDPY